MKDARFYIDSMIVNDVQNPYESAKESLFDDYRDEMMDIIGEASDNALVDLWNELCDALCRCDSYIYPMSELDDICGRMYPSEFFDRFSDFDYNDDWFTADLEMTAGFAGDLVDFDELTDNVIDGTIYHNTTYEMDDLMDEYRQVLADIEEEQEKEEQEKRRAEKVMKDFTSLVDFVAFNGTVEQVEAVTAAIWEAMQEQ